MAELKTKRTDASVEEYLERMADPARRAEARQVVEMMRGVTGSEPKIWGTGMIGFGQYHYRYATGTEGDWPLSAFALRKDNLTLYIMAGVERFPELLGKIGKHKVGKCCLYVKRLSDVDPAVLEELVRRSVAYMREQYGDAG